MDTIFDAFCRGKSRQKEGAGLGLYIVRCLADKLGHEEAAFYFKKEVEYMDSLAEKNKVEGTKDIQYKFDNDEVEERTTKNNLLAICICSCLGFLFIVAIIALVVMKRRKDKELLKAKADFTEYAEEIATLRKLNGDNKKELERLTKEMKKSMSDYIRSLSKGRL